MKEIKKCRIWDPEKNKYEYSGGTPMMQSTFFEYSARGHAVYNQCYEYSTGLYDKDGKERYDGDIIRRNTGYTFVEEQKWFSLGGAGNAKAYGYDYHPEDEIIGNIHDNPELLK